MSLRESVLVKTSYSRLAMVNLILSNSISFRANAKLVGYSIVTRIRFRGVYSVSSRQSTEIQVELIELAILL